MRKSNIPFICKVRLNEDFHFLEILLKETKNVPKYFASVAYILFITVYSYSVLNLKKYKIVIIRFVYKENDFGYIFFSPKWDIYTCTFNCFLMTLPMKLPVVY